MEFLRLAAIVAGGASGIGARTMYLSAMVSLQR